MSRTWLPRRNRAGLTLLLALAWAVTASSAMADEAPITIGVNMHVDACIPPVVAGDSSDRTIAECTAALGSSQVTAELMTQVRLHRGVAYLRRDQAEAALADFDAVIARSRRNAIAHLNRGSALISLNRFGEAIAAFTEALGLGVAEPHIAYYNRGVAREALGDRRGALEDYSTALEIEPDWGPANAELARIARTRRDQLATAAAERARP